MVWALLLTVLIGLGALAWRWFARLSIAIPHARDAERERREGWE